MAAKLSFVLLVALLAVVTGNLLFPSQYLTDLRYPHLSDFLKYRHQREPRALLPYFPRYYNYRNLESLAREFEDPEQDYVGYQESMPVLEEPELINPMSRGLHHITNDPIQIRDFNDDQYYYAPHHEIEDPSIDDFTYKYPDLSNKQKGNFAFTPEDKRYFAQSSVSSEESLENAYEDPETFISKEQIPPPFKTPRIDNELEIIQDLKDTELSKTKEFGYNKAQIHLNNQIPIGNSYAVKAKNVENDIPESSIKTFESSQNIKNLPMIDPATLNEISNKKKAFEDPSIEFEEPRKLRQNPNLAGAKLKNFVVDGDLDKNTNLYSSIRLSKARADDIPSSLVPASQPRHVHVVQRAIERSGAQRTLSVYVIALIAGIAAAGLVGIVGFALGWYTIRKRAKAAADVEYPAYGVTGPNSEISPSGDRRLAHSAQLYHYQHQKQQIIATERNSGERNGSISDPESEDENEEGDYTVYECPGYATTGEMEVKNPLYSDDPTPASQKPGAANVQSINITVPSPTVVVTSKK